MATANKLKKIAAGVAAVIGILLLSYCSEAPKYNFERQVKRTVENMPGARVIDSERVIDLASPIEWFWPPKTTWTFAVPDPMMKDRFIQATAIYDEATSPIVYLVDVDCADRSAVRYDLEEPDNAFPARNLWGDPVVAPNGSCCRSKRQDLSAHRREDRSGVPGTAQVH